MEEMTFVLVAWLILYGCFHLAVMSVAAPWVAFAVNGGNVGAAEDGALKSLKFVKTSSGLRYADVVTGSGSSPQEGDIVVVDYVGYLSNGQVFDNSKSPGRKPLAFPLGQRKVIPAWEEALSTMKSGGTRKIIVPPSLAYGDRGVCVPSGECLIPPNETLEYDLKLLRIAPPPI